MVYQYYSMFLNREAKNMPPHHEFDHKIHLEMTRHLLTATSIHSGTELGLLCEFLNNILGKGFI